MRRKEIVIVAMLMFALVLAGCGAKNESGVTIIGGADGPTSVFLASKNDKNSYTQIDQETAKLMIDIEDGHVIVDVRRQDEFDEGHIPGAICIPNESIIDTQLEELPDLNQIILVYCRSGRRSKEASQKLFDITIIGIPFGKQFFKIARVALLPFGARVVRVHY